MDELHHEGGVAGLYYLLGRTGRSAVWSGDPDTLSRLLPRMLLDLKNRGQLAAGMSTVNPARDQILDTYKEIGTVIEAFRINHPGKFASIMEDFAGRAAIGHTRYATCGATSRSYAQPFERRHGCKWKWFAFGLRVNLGAPVGVHVDVVGWPVAVEPVDVPQPVLAVDSARVPQPVLELGIVEAARLHRRAVRLGESLLPRPARPDVQAVVAELQVVVG